MPIGRENKNYCTRHKYTVHYTDIPHTTQVYRTLVDKWREKIFKDYSVQRPLSGFCTLEGLSAAVQKTNPRRKQRNT